MNKVEDIAVIFISKLLPTGEVELIPDKIVEGYLDEEDNFIDTEGYEYPHITDNRKNTRCYGFRKSIQEEMEQSPYFSVDEIKRKMLLFVQMYTYIRDLESIICAEDKKTHEKKSFDDNDTLYIQDKYCPCNQSNQVSLSLPNIDTVPSDNCNYSMGYPSTMEINPQEITTRIKEVIKGQDEAIQSIVTNIRLNLRHVGSKKNMLVMGPSGCGKTAIFKKLEKILDIPVIVISMTGMSIAGYSGSGVDEILQQIVIECDGDVAKAEKCIVILDEIDKIAKDGSTQSRVTFEGVQNELLKIVEGSKKLVEINKKRTVILDTTNIIFVGVGAFSDLFDDNHQHRSIGFEQETTEKEPQITTDSLKKYGMTRELLRRFPVKILLNKLTKENLKEIIIDSPESELMAYVNELKEYNITCINIDELVDVIVEAAIEEEIGASGLLTTINKIFERVMYEVYSNPNAYQELIFNPNILDDSSDYRLVKRGKILQRAMKD